MKILRTDSEVEKNLFHFISTIPVRGSRYGCLRLCLKGEDVTDGLASLAAPLVSGVWILLSMLKRSAAGRIYLTVNILGVTQDATFLYPFYTSTLFRFLIPHLFFFTPALVFRFNVQSTQKDTYFRGWYVNLKIGMCTDRLWFCVLQWIYVYFLLFLHHSTCYLSKCNTVQALN